MTAVNGTKSFPSEINRNKCLTRICHFQILEINNKDNNNKKNRKKRHSPRKKLECKIQSFFNTDLSNGLFYTYNLWSVFATTGHWSRCRSGLRHQRKRASAVFSISHNFIPNRDMFGILDNISEFVQKSIMSS